MIMRDQQEAKLGPFRYAPVAAMVSYGTGAMLLFRHRLRYLAGCNRKLFSKNRNLFIIFVLFFGQAFLVPSIFAAPVLPFINGEWRSHFPVVAFIAYLGCCIVWLDLQRKFLAEDEFIKWFGHFPIDERMQALSKIPLRFCAVGPLWLPWVMTLVVVLSGSKPWECIRLAALACVFFMLASLLLRASFRFMDRLVLLARRIFPLADLQIAVIGERHIFDVMLRQLLSLGLVHFGATLWMQPERSGQAIIIAGVALFMVVLISGDTAVLLAAAHDRVGHYFKHFPHYRRRRIWGDTAICAIGMVPSAAYTFVLLSAHASLSLVSAASVCLTACAMAALGALPAFTGSPDRRLVFAVVSGVAIAASAAMNL